MKELKISPDLHDTLLFEDLYTVRKLINIDINKISAESITDMVMITCESSTVDVIEKLQYLTSSINFNVDLDDVLGQTPLFHACLSNNYDVVKFILSFSPQMYKSNNDGESPLTFATYRNKYPDNTIRALKENDYDINRIDDDGETFLTFV